MIYSLLNSYELYKKTRLAKLSTKVCQQSDVVKIANKFCFLSILYQIVCVVYATFQG